MVSSISPRRARGIPHRRAGCALLVALWLLPAVPAQAGQAQGGDRARPVLSAEALVDSAATYVEVDAGRAVAFGLQAYEAAQRAGDRHVAAAARFQAAEALVRQGALDAAIAHYEAAIRLWTEVDNRIRLAEGYTRLGDAQEAVNQLAGAEASHRQAMDLYEDEGDRAGVAAASNNLGLLCWRVGRFEEAVQHYEKAFALWEALGDELNMARAHNNLGVIFYQWAGYAQAIEHYRASLDLRKRIGDERGTALVLNNIGKTYQAWGQLDQALEVFEEAYGYARTLEADQVLAYTLYNLATLHAATGAHAQALDEYERAEAVYRTVDFVGGVLETRLGKALLYGEAGRAEEALPLLEETLRAARAAQLAVIEATALQGLGRLHATMGDHRAAIARFVESLGKSESLDKRDMIRDNYALISASFEALGDAAQALSYFKRYAAEEDSIFGDRTARLFAELEARHEAHRVADANALLRRDGERRNLVLLFISVTLAVVLTAAFWLYRANRQKRDLNRQLEASNVQVLHERDEQKALLQILCHDLANPLGSIRGCLELMLEAPESVQELGPMALMVTRQGIDTIQLVRDMQVLDRGELVLEPVEVREAANAALLALRSRLEEKQITVDVDIDPEVRVWAERRSLANSVIANLLSNAIKFSLEGGHILLHTKAGRDEVRLCIRDYGVGIPDPMKAHLFDMHRSSSRAGTSGESGSGFGLPLVGRFVRLYGGRIEIESRERKVDTSDHGTQVCVVLPAVVDADAPLPAHVAAAN